ncbi:hypothetical protein FQA39_LY01143 [Lamprigera yunnana]|nr:hypothetical protein FQA39_LY01143 [Lamprigera yunnana]
MDSHYLLNDELAYELKIRGVIGLETRSELPNCDFLQLFAALDKAKRTPVKSISDNHEQFSDEVLSVTQNENVVLKFVDLSCFQSVREFAADIVQTETRLNVLIHAASVFPGKNLRTEDGFDVAMATNLLGPFLLTHLLIDTLKRSAPSRIIILTSPAYFYGSLNFDDYNNYIPSTWPQFNYFNSKFAAMCWANELSRRLENTCVTVNSVHPGFITPANSTAAHLPNWVRKRVLKSAEEAALVIVHFAVDKDLETTTGEYFVNYKPTKMSARTRNFERNFELWERFKAQVKMDSFEPKI